MKLARFTKDGATRIGKVVGDTVVDLSSITGPGSSMKSLLERYDELRGALEAAGGPGIPLSQVKLEAPIDDPRKFLAIGLNYASHVAEGRGLSSAPIPETQVWFNKQVTCITGPYDPTEFPKASTQLDHEVELGVVIGKRCRHVSLEDARSVIAGYLVCNDVSARDWQMRSPTWTLGKSFDTHGPIGPWLTTDDEIADPHNLNIWLTVNGDERQRANTKDMIYNIYQQIEHLTQVMTLEPGDLIATGTTEGVGIATGKLLKVGDVVRTEIEQLGYIENKVVPEA